MSILVIIFSSYSAAYYLADAAQGMLPVDTILSLILLRTIIALEVLLPIALYLTVVVSLGRLYTDHEMDALAACGFSQMSVLRVVLLLSVIVALAVGSLSLHVRPWAYEQSYLLRSYAETQFDINELEAGHFYEGEEAKRVIYVDDLDRKQRLMENVFVQSGDDKSSKVIYARQAYRSDDDTVERQVMIFQHGHAYQLDRNGNDDVALKFNRLILHLEPSIPEEVGYRRKAATTSHLSESSNTDDIAEFQWRMSMPAITVLLGLLGVPLSRSAPRKGRYAKMLVAILVYALFYNLNALAKSWIEQGVVGPIPGIWWVPAGMAALLMALVYRSGGFRRSA